MGDIEMGADAANVVSVAFYVAECMEFPRYGEYKEDIKTAKEAVKLYRGIPSERLNAIKGIGVHVQSQDWLMPEEYQLVHKGIIDIDELRLTGAFAEYPQIMEAVKALITEMPELEIIDTKKLLDEKMEPCLEVDVTEVAGKINHFQKLMDPEGYESFFPDQEKHKNKIAMQLLTEEGKAEYIKWLELGRSFADSELTEESQQLLKILKEADIKFPCNMEPFVYVECSEDWGLEAGDALELEEAVYLFGKLDYEQCAARKKERGLGYNKTWFRIYYLNEGEMCTYSGRQDFGDGDGDLFQHIEAHHNFYLSGEGQGFLQSLPEHEAKTIKESCEYVRDEFLPMLKYFCNLKQIETALLEERQINTIMPLISEQNEARSQYQKDVLSYVEESRRALNYGGELPELPDMKDYEQGDEYKGYRDQVEKEIEAEAKACGMTVDEYAQNGYEPKTRKR